MASGVRRTSEVSKLARRILDGTGIPDGIDAKVLARGYRDLETENERLRQTIAASSVTRIWVGYGERLARAYRELAETVGARRA